MKSIIFFLSARNFGNISLSFSKFYISPFWICNICRTLYRSVFFPFFVMLSSFLFSSFLFSSVFAASSDIDTYKIEMKDLYMQNYKSIAGSGSERDDITKNALKKVSDQMDIPQEIITSILKNKICTDGVCSPVAENFLESLCPGQKESTMKAIECREIVRKRFQEEQSRGAFAFRQQKFAMASQLFVNGTLQDTNGKFFDIVVDLNIIDVLLFGDHADLPFSPSPFFPQTDSQDSSSDNSSSSAQNNSSGNSTGDSGSSGISAENQDSQENTGDANASNTADDSQDTDEDTGDSKENENNKNTELEGFCRDPDALYFASGNTSASGGKNSQNSSSDSSSLSISSQDIQEGIASEKTADTLSSHSNIDRQLGNFFPEESLLYGGKYPDTTSFDSDNSCGEGKEGLPFLGGRICVPEFCTDIFCVKVTMKPGYRKVPLRNQDCVECHIDRANEALAPLVASKGKNTPNSNPMEDYFLSAFANLFGSKGIKVNILYKPLPFLVYDTPLHKQKEKSKNNEEKQKQEKQNREKRTAQLLKKNKSLFASIDPKCSEIGESFSSSPNALFFVEYCNKLKAERAEVFGMSDSSGAFAPSVSELAQENKNKSDTYNTIVKSFVSPLSQNMTTINSHILSITPEGISQNKLSCTTIAK